MMHTQTIDHWEPSLPISRIPLRLLPGDALVKTSPLDHAAWNFRPFLGVIQRLRFKFARELLGGRRVGRLLEIGYGSGIFQPELARHCDDLHGIDVHGKQAEVAEKLAGVGVMSRLRSGSAVKLPYADRLFDCVVAVSSLEFVDDLRMACREIRRVLGPGGCLVVVIFCQLVLVDFGLKILTGESAKNDFGNRRAGLIDTLLEFFDVDERRTAPWLYNALSLRAKRVERAPAPRRMADRRMAILETVARGSASIPSSMRM